MIFLIIFLFLPSEQSLIKESLDLLDLSEHDLGYGKRWPREDSFRLEVINRLMDDPLSIPDHLEEILSELNLNRIGRELGMELKIEGGRGDPLTELKKRIRSGDSLIRSALAGLTTAELESLLVQIPIIWADEDDSLDDTLKAVLIKGVVIDTGFEWECEDILRIAKKIEVEKIISAGASLYELIPDLIRWVDTLSESLPSMLEVGGYKVVIGSRGDDRYEDGDIIIDPGGNDRYSGGAGIGLKKLGMIIDLEGDDVYDSDRFGAIGGGILGVGIVYDLSGSDRYLGLHHSLGSGLFGLGILEDCAGDDSYEGGFFAQGAGNFGVGLLIDRAGNDRYRIYCNGQGFGSVVGFGALIDSSGNDSYYAGGKYRHHPLLPENYRSFAQGFAIGWRPHASGGIGILYDGGGNDSYEVEVYGQGTSYWFSLGCLIDRAGNDRYLATEYAQGAGIHYALGYLLDESGSDLYYSTHGPAQGEGHDLSVGILIDRKGDDSYITSGGQGVGIFNSIGILIDGGGNDHYFTYEAGLGQGSANWRRGFPGLGLFIDQGGEDVYPFDKAGDDRVWFQGRYGVGIDINSLKVEVSYPIQPEDTAGLDTLPQDSLIKELFERASLWRVRENIELVDWARNRLKEIGPPAVSYAFTERINTDSPLVLRALKWLGREMKEEARPYLAEALKSDIDTVIKNGLYLIGEIGDSALIESVLPFIDHEDFRIRSQAIRTAGKIGDPIAVERIKRHIQDPVEIVRIRAAEALGRIKDPGPVTDLILLLDDEFFTVRYTAADALKRIGEPAIDPLIRWLKLRPYLIIEVLSEIGKDLGVEEKRKISDAISPYVSSRDPVLATRARGALKKLKLRSFLTPHQLLQF